mmetsp:Transcript_38580/g.98671  ORF Transcript_38580/g.98671 Transcript_38580/m.98671 type:complete len:303 (+) Transcript_38580:404-1312(+)
MRLPVVETPQEGLWKVWKDRRLVERDDRVPRLVAGLLQVRAGDAVWRLCHHPVVGVLAHGALEVILVKARDVSRHVAGAQRLLVPALVVHLVGARVESRGALLFVHRYWAVEDGGCGEHIEVRNHQRRLRAAQQRLVLGGQDVGHAGGRHKLGIHHQHVGRPRVLQRHVAAKVPVVAARIGHHVDVKRGDVRHVRRQLCGEVAPQGGAQAGALRGEALLRGWRRRLLRQPQRRPLHPRAHGNDAVPPTGQPQDALLTGTEATAGRAVALLLSLVGVQQLLRHPDVGVRDEREGLGVGLLGGA